MKKFYRLVKEYRCGITGSPCIEWNNAYKNQPPDCENCEIPYEYDT